MVDRDIEEGRITRALIGEELHLPKYPDLTSAPNTEGLSVLITGNGDDPAGAYTYANSQWSGPAGGPSNLPDTTLGQDESVPNTEKYSFGEYLRGSVDPDNGKHVIADIDTDTADERYFRIITDSFDGHAPTDPTQDAPTTPQTWRFESGAGSTDVRGGYYSTDTPPSTQSARSFGVPFVNTTAPDGRSISSGIWALSKEYAVGAGGETLTVSAWAQPNATYSGYDDGVAHSEDETYIGEDDVLVGIECYDSSLQAIALDITTEYSRTASHQYFAAGETDDLTSQQWVRFSHEATLPADTTYVLVRLQAVDKSNTWGTRGQSDTGNAAILVDDYTVSYTSGLAPSTVVSHDHDGMYAAESAFEGHTTNTNNPHQVTARQAGAIPNQNGAVAESTLGFDTATQQELDQHANTASAHHSRRTDAEVADALAGQSIGDNSPLSSINTEDVTARRLIGVDRSTTPITPTDGARIYHSGNGHTLHGGPNGGVIWTDGNLATPARQSDLFSGSHTDLSDISPNDHHSKYTDSEAVSAIDNKTITPTTVGTETDPVETGTYGTVSVSTTKAEFPNGPTATTTPIISFKRSDSIATSIDITGKYDFFLIDISAASSSPDDLRLRVNGDSSASYSWNDADGTTHSGETAWTLASADNDFATGQLRVSGQQTTSGGVGDSFTHISGDISGHGSGGLLSGEHRVSSSDTTALDFVPTGSDTIYKVDVYGKQLGKTV